MASAISMFGINGWVKQVCEVFVKLRYAQQTKSVRFLKAEKYKACNV